MAKALLFLASSHLRKKEEREIKEGLGFKNGDGRAISVFWLLETLMVRIEGGIKGLRD